MFEHVDLLFEFVLVPLFLKGPRVPVPDVLCDLEKLTKIVCEEYGGLGGIQFLNALEGEGGVKRNLSQSFAKLLLPH
jgi:hypothetical protein